MSQPLEAEADVSDRRLEDADREDLEVVFVGEVVHLLLLVEAEAGDAAPADHDEDAAVGRAGHLERLDGLDDAAPHAAPRARGQVVLVLDGEGEAVPGLGPGHRAQPGDGVGLVSVLVE